MEEGETKKGLEKLIRDEIEEKGPISFKRFMELSLYHPEYGYYTGSSFPIGACGDFITSAQASPLFGALMAVQVSELMEIIGEDAEVVEFGPGTGALAAGLLGYLKEHEKGLFQRLTYHLVEPFKSRRQPLLRALEAFSDRISLWTSYPDGAARAVVIANEVLDAFPVHVVHKKDGVFHEVFVDADQDGFREVLIPISHPASGHQEPSRNERLLRYIEDHLKDVPDDYRTEVNLEVKEWMDDLSRAFKKGFVIVIDYGFSRRHYLDPARNRGTILGYSRHMVTEDLLSRPGLVDLTAHVNFSDLKSWAEQAGFRPVGYAPQWAFLGGLDFEKTVRRVMGELDPFSPKLAGIKALIFPQAMGESHKVMMLSKGIDEGFVPKGFRLRNDLERL